MCIRHIWLKVPSSLLACKLPFCVIKQSARQHVFPELVSCMQVTPWLPLCILLLSAPLTVLYFNRYSWQLHSQALELRLNASLPNTWKQGDNIINESLEVTRQEQPGNTSLELHVLQEVTRQKQPGNTSLELHFLQTDELVNRSIATFLGHWSPNLELQHHNLRGKDMASYNISCAPKVWLLLSGLYRSLKFVRATMVDSLRRTAGDCWFVTLLASSEKGIDLAVFEDDVRFFEGRFAFISVIRHGPALQTPRLQAFPHICLYFFRIASFLFSLFAWGWTTAYTE